MIVKLSNISLYYANEKGSRRILSPFSFEFENGVYLIKGENGSGKSSLLKIISGEVLPTGGELCFLDEKKNAVTPKVFSSSKTLTYTNIDVLDYVRLLCYENKNPFDESLLEDIDDVLNIDAILRTKIEALSLSDRKKLALIPLLIEGYDVIIFDEAFKFIDPQEAVKIKDTLLERFGDKIVLAADHDSTATYHENYLLTIDKSVIKSKLIKKIEIKKGSEAVEEDYIRRRFSLLFFAMFFPLIEISIFLYA